MPFKRVVLMESGLARIARQGDLSGNPAITVVAADANDTLTMAKLAGNVVQYTGFTVGRTLTTDTAANILASNPDMDIGDAIQIKISIVPALAGTFAAGVGVTLAGRATCPAATAVDVYFIKTSATTMTWHVL